jgi:hypothetical protein
MPSHLGGYTFLYGLPKELNVGKHDLLHDTLVPKERAREKQLIRTKALAGCINEIRNRLVRLDLHIQQEHGSRTSRPAELRLHSFNQSKAILFSIKQVQLLEVFRTAREGNNKNVSNLSKQQRP